MLPVRVTDELIVYDPGSPEEVARHAARGSAPERQRLIPHRPRNAQSRKRCCGSDSGAGRNGGAVLEGVPRAHRDGKSQAVGIGAFHLYQRADVLAAGRVSVITPSWRS
jgi:hypothetical protein